MNSEENFKSNTYKTKDNYSEPHSFKNCGSIVKQIYQLLRKNQKETLRDFNEPVLDNFDRVANLKNYFPANNSKSMLDRINSKMLNTNVNKILNDKKRNLEKRLSKYTFFPEEMEQYIPGAFLSRKRLAGKSKVTFAYPNKQKSKSVKTLKEDLNQKSEKKFFWKEIIEQKFSRILRLVTKGALLKKMLRKKQST